MTITPVTKFNFAGVLYDTKEEATQAKAKSQLVILITRIISSMKSGMKSEDEAKWIVNELLDNDSERKILTNILIDFNEATNSVDQLAKTN